MWTKAVANDIQIVELGNYMEEEEEEGVAVVV